MASSVGHEFIIELLGKVPWLLRELLGPRLESRLGHAVTRIRFHRSDATVSQIPPLGCDLCIELYEPEATTPFMVLVVEVQLGIDERKPFSWVAYQAAQFCRLKVPAVLVVVTNDRKVAQWAAGPIWSGQTVLEPFVLGPGDVPAIIDPAVAQRSIELTFVSGVVHGQDMIAVRIGLALAHALDASPDHMFAVYWDTFLASLSEPVRKELEMQLRERQWEPRSDWGKEIFAKGMAEGERLGIDKGHATGFATGQLLGQVRGRAASILALLEHRGLSVDPALHERVLACTDLTLLDRWFRRAATGCSVEETFAS
jgi:hypothetical protein